MKADIALIGPGKVGCAVSRLLHRKGFPIKAVISRDQERAAEACRYIGCREDAATTDLQNALNAELIMLSVPDDQIRQTSTALNNLTGNMSDKTLIHFSGLLPASCLRADSQASVVSIHPLLPFADRDLASQGLEGCPCGIEGDPHCLPLAEDLVSALGGRPFPISSEEKSLYHAAACIASNYMVTLVDSAMELLQLCGIEEQRCLTLLRPLLEKTLKNTVELGPSKALTGPIVRGDQETVSRHLETISSKAPALLKLYTTLGERTLELAKTSHRISASSVEKIGSSLSN